MKTNTLFVGLILFSIILLSYGQNCCQRDDIQVEGFGENRIKPNIAILYMSISAQGSTSLDTIKALAIQVQQIRNLLRLQGMTQNQIATGIINIYPRYNHSNHRTVIVGYSIYLSLTITIRDIQNNPQKICKVIDSLDSITFISLNAISYDTQNKNTGKIAARNKAYNDALAKAEQYAQLTGRKLGKAIKVKQTSSSYTSFFYNTESPAKNSLQIQTVQNSMTKGISTEQTSTKTVTGSNNKPQIPIGRILITVGVVAKWQMI